MSKAIEKHRPDLSGKKVLDVGGVDLNGSYRPIFEEAASYTTLDRQGADINVSGYNWPDIGLYDIVISGQTLEHDPKFWLTVKNMADATTPGGLIVIIVPSRGSLHRHPVDCYRFLPDSMAALADVMQVRLLETVAPPGKEAGIPINPISRGMPDWGDVVGVFSKPTAR